MNYKGDFYKVQVTCCDYCNKINMEKINPYKGYIAMDNTRKVKAIIEAIGTCVAFGAFVMVVGFIGYVLK